MFDMLCVLYMCNVYSNIIIVYKTSKMTTSQWDVNVNGEWSLFRIYFLYFSFIFSFSQPYIAIANGIFTCRYMNSRFGINHWYCYTIMSTAIASELWVASLAILECDEISLISMSSIWLEWISIHSRSFFEKPYACFSFWVYIHSVNFPHSFYFTVYSCLRWFIVPCDHLDIIVKKCSRLFVINGMSVTKFTLSKTIIRSWKEWGKRKPQKSEAQNSVIGNYNEIKKSIKNKRRIIHRISQSQSKIIRKSCVPKIVSNIFHFHFHSQLDFPFIWTLFKFSAKFRNPVIVE